MTGRNRNAFTLVELLVVVVIIGMLVGLMVPAIQMARQRARQTECQNNQHELALGIHQYESAKGDLPGYSNHVGLVATNLSWVQVLFPYTGRNDVWDIVRKGTYSLNDLPRGIRQFTCPTSQADRDFALSYVVNCGQYTPANSNAPINGLFIDRGAANATAKMNTSKIKDGASNTLMLSENLQATQWKPLNAAKLGPSVTARGPYVIDLGMLWTKALALTCDPTKGVAPVNGCGDFAPEFPWADAENGTDALKYRHWARPSSAHPGGVIVTYADGHQDFLNENVDEATFLNLMDPAGDGTRNGP
jgi:prepilin-type N-terminal cleavage/methylation domain-containing protein/prepilin-type processing-associated H-X9-DG protein